jgi:2-desacetyl-2-hydroxyethyl bacteriochlorophyllide A dehydrogenase
VQLIQALVCSAPGHLQMERRPAPTSAPTLALVRPLRVGVCGTDYHIFQGKHPFLQYPRVMGHELAVEVVQAPPGSPVETGAVCVVNPYISCDHCIACRAGKPNCCVNISVLGVHRDGGMTELISVPPVNLVRADGLSVDECAAVEFLAIGAHAVRRAAVSGSDNVLVVGAGPIGLGAALFARLTGARVVVLDHDSERAETAESIIGVTALPAVGDALQAAKASTEGNGFDVVFDATGSQKAMEAGFDFVAHGGRYVLVSVIKDSVTFMDPDFHRKEITLLGSRNATNQDFERVIGAMRDGDVPVDRLITHRTDMAGAVKDIPRWATEKSGLVKAVVELD